MIVVRDIFQVKFGKAQDAIAVWKEGNGMLQRMDKPDRKTRMLTDLAGGNYYTLILESDYDSLTEYEESMNGVMGNGEWKKWYQKFLPLAETGHREILKVVG